MASRHDDDKRERLALERSLLLHSPEDANQEHYTEDGSVDIYGNPVSRMTTGRWRACPFILGFKCCECLGYFGIGTNLVNYLTIKLHEGNVLAASSVTTWQGTCYITPLIGAFIADSLWGRYWTNTVFSIICFIGMCTLTLSAAVPALRPPSCDGSVCPEANSVQFGIFFIGLYLIALGAGGIKPCVSTFGADQFDNSDPAERFQKASYFNWLYFSVNAGSLFGKSFLVYVQDNYGWELGFGIPALFMGLAITIFVTGTPRYRHQKPIGSPLTNVIRVICASLCNWKKDVPDDSSLLFEITDGSGTTRRRKLQHSDEFRFLDKAATIGANEKPDNVSPWRLCTVTQVEEVKILTRLLPIWITGILFSAVRAQLNSMFIEQADFLDPSIGTFKIPPASLSMVNSISVLFLVPAYDMVFMPIMRKFTGIDKGIGDMQRMGIGLVISILAMVSAAVLEIQRLAVARAAHLEDSAMPVPLSILWQIPQYFLLGAAEVFTWIGQLEFFYDQSPDTMKSLVRAMSLLVNALGNYLSSFILTMVTAITTSGGNPGWIPDNLNKGHLDYFFWLLAALSFLNLLVYVWIAMRYKFKSFS